MINIDIGRLIAEIGRKIANGQLLFLALLIVCDKILPRKLFILAFCQNVLPVAMYGMYANIFFQDFYLVCYLSDCTIW